MTAVAGRYDLDTVVRICHDKIFLDPDSILECLETFHESDLDYLYSSQFVDGSGFEIISASSLKQASLEFKDVEHVSYAIQCVTDRVCNLGSIQEHPIRHRLLIDYPEDVKLIQIILTTLGNDCTLKEVLEFLDKNPKISKINRLPLLTVYTCAYNADQWLGTCMGTVAAQEGFRDHEYLLIDDYSKDKTTYLMSQFCSIYSNSKWFRNESNLGLASSSNIALSHARGKYILRLDADDYFPTSTALKEMLSAIEESGLDVIYPDNYYGSFKTIQKGFESHHVGGAIFRTRAANHVKFTNGLRGYEGYDFFSRAQNQLKIGYLDKPIFFYRQHPNSMSKTNLDLRKQIKEQIDEQKTRSHRPDGAVF
jgi:spore coat polysaccharide biosynthesis protein SpsF (cytidylyltransferase family)